MARLGEVERSTSGRNDRTEPANDSEHTDLVVVEIHNPYVVEVLDGYSFIREETGRHADDERRWNEQKLNAQKHNVRH